MRPVELRSVFGSLKDHASDPIHRAIVGAGLISMAVRIAGVLLSYGANVYLSRLLGVKAFGEYVIALSWALVLALPAKAGLDNSALRYSTIYLERDDLGALRGFVRFASGIVLLGSAAIGVFVYVYGSTFIPVSSQTLMWAAVLIIPLALLAFLSVIMRTARKVVAAQSYDQVLRPCLILLIVAGITLTGHRLTAASAMQVTALAAALALAAIFIHLQHALRASKLHQPSYRDRQQWLKVSFSMLIGGAVQELMNQLDILFLGQLANGREAALFAASWRIASLVPFALIALATLSAPMVASAHERRSLEELHRISKVVARLGFGFGLAGALFLLAAGHWLLIPFGSEFAAAFPVLAILLLGGIVNAFTGIVTYFMTMTGRERPASLIFVSSLLVSVALNLLLIPRWGAVGAAIASSAGTATWNLVMLAYVRRTIGIDASALALAPLAQARTI